MCALIRHTQQTNAIVYLSSFAHLVLFMATVRIVQLDFDFEQSKFRNANMCVPVGLLNLTRMLN